MNQVLVILLYLLALTNAQAAVTYSKPLTLGTDGATTVSAIATDASGNLYLTGSTYSTNLPTTPGVLQPSIAPGTCTTVFDPHSPPLVAPCTDAFVVKLNPNGSVVFCTYFGGSGIESGSSIAVDGSGNIYVAGTTWHQLPSPNDFPVTPGAAYGTQGIAVQRDGFVFKVNPQGTAVLYSTLIPGAGTSPTSMALDAAGNVYFAGVVFASTPAVFQPTPGAYQVSAVAGSSHGVIVKINPAGSAFTYATYLGGNNSDFIQGLAIDPSGNVYLTGQTSSTDFPTTAGVVQPSRPADVYSAGFVTKLDASGSALAYSTYFGATYLDTGLRIRVDSTGAAIVLANSGHLVKLSPQAGSVVYSTQIDGANNLDLDASDDAIVVATTSIRTFPMTPGGTQRCFAGGLYDVLLAQYDPAGNLTASSYLGGSGIDSGYSVAAGPAGFTYAAGTTNSLNFPGFTFPTAAGVVTSQSIMTFVSKLKIADPAQPDLPCMAMAAENGASFQEGPISPGELITLRGLGFGPEQGVQADPISNGGRFPTLLTGVRVLFDGTPAPLLYVQSRQINVQAPFELTPNSVTRIQVEFDGVMTSGFIFIPVVPATPAIFLRSFDAKLGAILNADGTPNSATNPAQRGSVVSLYGTGGGPTSPPGISGGLSSMPATLEGPVTAQIAFYDAPIQYAGLAPTLSSGVFQVNLYVPAEVPTGLQSIRVNVGTQGDAPYLLLIALQ